MTTCKACGKTVPEKARCIFCGAQLLAMVKCPACAHELPPPTGAACRYCGAALPKPGADPAPAAGARPGPAQASRSIPFSAGPTAPPAAPSATPAAVPGAGVPPPAGPTAVSACRQCGEKFSATLAWCPKCNTPVPGRTATAADAERQANLELARAILAESRPGPLSRPLQAILLVLGLPVLVPSLMLAYASAKRWGRVPYVYILVDGFIMALFGLKSTALLVAAVVGTLACMALAVVRHARLGQGIFLGYSNVVAMLFIAGGLLLGFSAVAGFFLDSIPGAVACLVLGTAGVVCGVWRAVGE